MDKKIPIADLVSNFIEPIVNDNGCELVDVEYTKKQNGMNLTIFIDKTDGVGLDDCERVHMAIDGPLDELDPTSGKAYILNVSSPGLDRPLKTDKDLKKNIGTDIELHLFSQIDKKKDFVGKLISFDEKEIIIEIDKKSQSFGRDAISNIKKYINF